MNEQQMHEKVLEILAGLAPEADVHSLRSDVRIRDQIDIDSMDFLNFLIGVDAEIGVDIPESDYPRLATLDSIYEYLRSRTSARPA
jgi:acyl carrier protein